MPISRRMVSSHIIRHLIIHAIRLQSNQPSVVRELEIVYLWMDNVRLIVGVR